MASRLKHNEDNFVLAQLVSVKPDGTRRMQSHIPLDLAMKQWERREFGATLRLKDLRTGEWSEGWTQDYEPNKAEAEPYSVVLGRSQDYKKIGGSIK